MCAGIHTSSYIHTHIYIRAGALGIGVLLCLFHSVMREPPELFDGDASGMHGSTKYDASLASVAVAGSAASLRTAFQKLWNTDIDAISPNTTLTRGVVIP